MSCSDYPLVAPMSCDTFVALPPSTRDGAIVFGKNSDRPGDEVQELVYYPATDHLPGAMTKCTYIEIAAAPHTHAVVLSKPAWMWGAEMGANQHGVVIGNEAVWTRLTGSEGSGERLLGMDLLRLGLERGSSALEALQVITSLLTKHGQGGRCFENPDWAAISYCNSFIVADRSEAWVLETAGRHWAARRFTEGVMNISNQLTLGTELTLTSEGLKEHAVEAGFWDPKQGGAFNFSLAYSADSPVKRPLKGTAQYRMTEGRKLLEKLSANGAFNATSMFSILRDDESGICCTGACVSVASQVSVLYPHPPHTPHTPTMANSASLHATHWFTATPNPSRSIFKPFVFTTAATPDLGDAVRSPDYGDADPCRTKPRFRRTVERSHPLYSAHSSLPPVDGTPEPSRLQGMKELEGKFVGEMEGWVKGSGVEWGDEFGGKKLAEVFKQAVVAEMELYK